MPPRDARSAARARTDFIPDGGHRRAGPRGVRWRSSSTAAYLAFVALSPVMLIGNAISERHRGNRGYRQRLAEFERQRTSAGRPGRCPARGACLPAPCASRSRVPAAHRRGAQPPAVGAPPGDDDFLTLRIGTGRFRGRRRSRRPGVSRGYRRATGRPRGRLPFRNAGRSVSPASQLTPARWPGPCCCRGGAAQPA